MPNGSPSASPRIGGLVMGTSDLTKDLQAHHTRDRVPMLTSLGLCLLAARAFDIGSWTACTWTLDDMAGFEAACHQGHDMGFDGKTLIHPRPDRGRQPHLRPERRGGRPGRAASSRPTARRRAAGKGVVVIDGRLIENLHVQDARRTLALSNAAIRRISEASFS